MPRRAPRDPRAWLTTVATRRLVDARRSEVARRRREEATYAEPRPRVDISGVRGGRVLPLTPCQLRNYGQ